MTVAPEHHPVCAHIVLMKGLRTDWCRVLRGQALLAMAINSQLRDESQQFESSDQLISVVLISNALPGAETSNYSWISANASMHTRK